MEKKRMCDEKKIGKVIELSALFPRRMIDTMNQYHSMKRIFTLSRQSNSKVKYEEDVLAPPSELVLRLESWAFFEFSRLPRIFQMMVSRDCRLVTSFEPVTARIYQGSWMLLATRWIDADSCKTYSLILTRRSGT